VTTLAASKRSFRPRLATDLEQTLRPLRWAGPRDPSVIVNGDNAWRASLTPSGPATVHITSSAGDITVEAWGPGADWALEHTPTLLGQDDNIAGFEPRDAVIADLHRHFAGMRIMRSLAVMEALVPAIMEQKVIGLEFRRGYARLVREMGERAPGPVELYVPPPASKLAMMPYWAFHPFAVERRRAETVVRAARRATRLETLTTLPPAVAREKLCTIDGIGPWTAAKVALVALGDADAVPIGDYHLPSAVSWLLAGKARGDDDLMLKLLEPYRGQRGRVARLILMSGVGAPRFGPRLPLRRLERH
jgi:3-methyladenine DNA glycosylase/8-oxoguanine DNA glycosylase